MVKIMCCSGCANGEGWDQANNEPVWWHNSNIEKTWEIPPVVQLGLAHGNMYMDNKVLEHSSTNKLLNTPTNYLINAVKSYYVMTVYSHSNTVEPP